MNSAEKLKKILKKERPKRIFLVTSGSYKKTGAEKKFGNILKQFQTKIFLCSSPNPTLAQIQRCISALKKSRADLIVAIGGGNVIDTAKAANTLAAQKKSPVSYIKKGQKIAKLGKPLVAVPTTAGTGSEATHFAVIYINNIKYSLAHNFLKPNYFILEPGFTCSLPPKITAATGMDALSQAIESFWSKKATRKSKKYSVKALKLILPNLKSAVQNPSPISRKAMMNGAHLAGKAIDMAQTTASHAMSYPLTIHYGIPHGHAVALTLPETIMHNATAMKKGDRAKLLSALNSKTPKNAAASISRLMKNIGLETSLRELGIKNLKKIQNLMTKEVNLERLSNNPKTLTIEDIRAILRNIF